MFILCYIVQKIATTFFYPGFTQGLKCAAEAKFQNHPAALSLALRDHTSKCLLAYRAFFLESWPPHEILLS